MQIIYNIVLSIENIIKQLRMYRNCLFLETIALNILSPIKYSYLYQAHKRKNHQSQLEKTILRR